MEIVAFSRLEERSTGLCATNPAIRDAVSFAGAGASQSFPNPVEFCAADEAPFVIAQGADLAGRADHSDPGIGRESGFDADDRPMIAPVARMISSSHVPADDQKTTLSDE